MALEGLEVTHLQPRSHSDTMGPLRHALFTGNLKTMEPIPGSQGILADPWWWPWHSVLGAQEVSESTQGVREELATCISQRTCLVGGTAWASGQLELRSLGFSLRVAAY